MKRWIIHVLAAALCILPLGVPALGAEAEPAEVTAAPYEGEIYFEGVQAGAWDGEGGALPFLSCGGSVYLPLCTAGQWMGADTLWDEERGTISIQSGMREPACPPPAPGSAAEPAGQERPAGTLRPDAVLCLDDGEVRFTNALGERTYPLVFQGELYLPLRGVGELLGMRVLWRGMDDGSSRIYLYEPMTFQQQYLDGSDYYLGVWNILRQVERCLADLENDRSLGGLNLQDEAVQEKLAALEALALSICEVEPPASGAYAPMADDINENVRYLVEIDLARYIDADAYLHPDYAALGWDWHRAHFFRTMRTDCAALDEALDDLSDQILAASALESGSRN